MRMSMIRRTEMLPYKVSFPFLWLHGVACFILDVHFWCRPARFSLIVNFKKSQQNGRVMMRSHCVRISISRHRRLILVRWLLLVLGLVEVQEKTSASMLEGRGRREVSGDATLACGEEKPARGAMRWKLTGSGGVLWGVVSLEALGQARPEHTPSTRHALARWMPTRPRCWRMSCRKSILSGKTSGSPLAVTLGGVGVMDMAEEVEGGGAGEG